MGIALGFFLMPSMGTCSKREGKGYREFGFSVAKRAQESPTHLTE